MSRTRYAAYESDQVYFATCTVVDWIPLFGIPWAAEEILKSLAYLQQHDGLIVYAYVLMEDHAHLLARTDDFAKALGRLKSYTARRIIDTLESKGHRSLLERLHWAKQEHKSDRPFQLWQEGSHPQQVQSEAMMRQKVAYIHANPVRRGYIEDETHWRYSSAGVYAGKKGLLSVETCW